MADTFFVLSLTISALYGVLCLISGIQTARIILYRHNIRSFHFGFLILVFFWTALRILFFSTSANWPVAIVLIVFWFPVDIQFGMFALIVVFYAWMVYQGEWERRRKLIMAIYVIANISVVFLTTLHILLGCHDDDCTVTPELQQAHHVYLGVQHCILVILFGVYSYKLAFMKQLPSFDHPRERGTRYIVGLSALIFLIFSSRCVYDFLAAFNIFSIDISEQTGGIKEVGPTAFVCLLVWEILPTLMVLWYFRKIPRTNVAWNPLRACCCCARSTETDMQGTPLPGSYATSPDREVFGPDSPMLPGDLLSYLQDEYREPLYSKRGSQYKTVPASPRGSVSAVAVARGGGGGSGAEDSISAQHMSASSSYFHDTEDEIEDELLARMGAVREVDEEAIAQMRAQTRGFDQGGIPRGTWGPEVLYARQTRR